ncbi:hypothetical protein RZE82_06070 [Mollicutes bacterium LVI A0039]|nr:hypothetical protein RZE82_06070 [Mollicutes bacterium LVI A0039]
MEIARLIDRSNRMFDLLEYTNHYGDNDEVVSLKISLNNLLISLESDNPNFFEVLMLSSPVLFDFAFNSKLDDVGLRLRKTFERQKNYEEAKKWYKFIRNSLIHTNRYTYNNFLKSIYRIEYSNSACIYFELEKTKVYRFEEFKQNRYLITNSKINESHNLASLFEHDNNVKICINYNYFNQFIFETITSLVRSVEHDIDGILSREVNKWNTYYSVYREVIDNVYWDRNIDIKQLKRLALSLKNLKDFNLEEAYILCEFLEYMMNLDVILDENMLEEIIQITTFDKYYQLERRSLILNEVSSIKEYPQITIDYDRVAWLINEIYPLTSENDQVLQILEHNNYLIIYVQKYLLVKGLIN